MMMLFERANLPPSRTDAKRGKVLESCVSVHSAQMSSMFASTTTLYSLLIGRCTGTGLISDSAFRLLLVPPAVTMELATGASAASEELIIVVTTSEASKQTESKQLRFNKPNSMLWVKERDRFIKQMDVSETRAFSLWKVPYRLLKINLLSPE